MLLVGKINTNEKISINPITSFTSMSKLSLVEAILVNNLIYRGVLNLSTWRYIYSGGNRCLASLVSQLIVNDAVAPLCPSCSI